MAFARSRTRHWWRTWPRNEFPSSVCITSNLRTGAVSSLAAHPVRRLYDAGVSITLNSDDPALFPGCTLASEYELAARAVRLHGRADDVELTL